MVVLDGIYSHLMYGAVMVRSYDVTNGLVVVHVLRTERDASVRHETLSAPCGRLEKTHRAYCILRKSHIGRCDCRVLPAGSIINGKRNTKGKVSYGR
jgi:hypothetical protein